MTASLHAYKCKLCNKSHVMSTYILLQGGRPEVFVLRGEEGGEGRGRGKGKGG